MLSVSGEGTGLLRLHSTYRHDLKIYSSDEGRVQVMLPKCSVFNESTSSVLFMHEISYEDIF